MGLTAKPWSHIVRILTFLDYDSRILSVWNNAFLERVAEKFRRGSENSLEVEAKKSAARKFECGVTI